MKKLFIYPALLCGALVSATSVYALSDRMDGYRADGTFMSFMVEDIENIIYLKSATDETFDVMRVSLYDGTQVDCKMDEFSMWKYAPITNNWLEILRADDGHSRVIMLDCINNDHIMSPDKPLDWTAERAGGTPHFLYKADLGYDATYTVKGNYTGNDYTKQVFWSNPEDNLLGRGCWTLFMPNEPITIETKAKERTTYLGEAFVGEYKGYQLNAKTSTRVCKSPEMTINLKYNESYTVVSTDEMKYNFEDLFVYNKSLGSFEYQQSDSEELKYIEGPWNGANGKFSKGDFAFVTVIDKKENKPENSRLYCTAKGDFKLSYAVRDTYGSQYMLEVTNADGTNRWFFLDNYGYLVKDAEMNFVSGSSIMKTCEALVSYDGEVQMKYVFTEGGEPQFIAKSVEAGTYKAEGGGEDLVLDGFGSAKLGTATYPYTVEGTVVTIVIAGEVHLYNIDLVAKTYKEAVSDEWNGGTVYKNEAVNGFFNGNAGAKNRMNVTFNKDLMGNDAPGKVAISVEWFDDSFFKYSQEVADVQSYLYDAANKTITITNVYIGSADGNRQRKNLVFKVADDMKRIYLEGEGDAVSIYSPSNAKSYVTVDVQNALVCDDLAPQVALQPEYTGTLTFDYYGMPGEAAVTLSVDKDATGAEKPGFATLKVIAMGTQVFGGCVEYAFDGAALTLKGVTVGDGNYGTKVVDLVFTLQADGTLLGSGKYYGASMDTAFMSVDLGSGALAVPAE